MKGMLTFPVAILSLALAACGPHKPEPDNSNPTIGDTVLLMDSAGKMIGAAISSESYQDLQKAFAANDDEGIQELMNAGFVFAVTSGTTARLLDFEVLGPRLVRILDGPYKGQKAWVFDGHIHGFRRDASSMSIADTLRPADPARFLDSARGSDSAKAFVRKNWDAILTTCPGLLTYDRDLAWNGIEDMSDPSYQANVRGTGIRLVVSEHATRIPSVFRAFGHHCSFRVTPDEQHLIIEKTPCAEVCLEREIPRMHENLLLPLLRPAKP